jgi:hypothetical protein
MRNILVAERQNVLSFTIALVCSQRRETGRPGMPSRTSYNKVMCHVPMLSFTLSRPPLTRHCSEEHKYL